MPGPGAGGAMKSRSGITAFIAAAVAVLLVALSASTLIGDSGQEQEAPGLTLAFQRLDADYQRTTQDFVDQTKELEDADLRTALRLYGLVLDGVQDARAALAELPTVPQTQRPVERMDRALEVQQMALESAMVAARNRDEAGTRAASEQFQTAVLAYMAARAEMLRALDSCGEDCR